MSTRTESGFSRRIWLAMGVVLLLAAAVPGAAPAQVPCPANPAWVTHPSYPNFINDPNTLCGFYQYAWQIFLKDMSPVTPKAGAPTTANAAAASPLQFETLSSLTETVGPELAAKPAQLLGPKTTFHDQRTGKDRVFQVRGSEPNHSIEQAGSAGILVDQNGNVTYYEQFLDPVAKAFFSACSIPYQPCETVPAAQALRFPPGAMELKVSYRVLTPTTPNANTYITVPNVPVYNPQVKDPKTGKYGVIQVVNLGMVGYHLVFATSHHPELIWSTFEHVDNAPDGPCINGKTTTPPPPFTKWAFNNRASTSCTNINNWPYPPPPPQQPPPYPVTQAFRNWLFGSIPNTPNGNLNTQTLLALNKSVLGILPPSSVLKYYFLAGGIWTNGTLPPTPTNEVGGLYLANATLETFTQTANPNPTFALDCFSCHTNATGGNPPTLPPYTVSHAAGTSQGPCPYSTTLPPACQATQKIPPGH
jgi:hypothetical protein